MEQHLSLPGQSLPSICLCLSPPRLHFQPRFLQPPRRSSVGRPHALPGQPPPSGCAPRQLGLQPEPAEFKRLPQRPQRLPRSPPPPHPHPAPPPYAPFIPNPRLGVGSQVQSSAAAWGQEPHPVVRQRGELPNQRGGEDGDGPRQQRRRCNGYLCHLESLGPPWILGGV